MGTPGSEPHRGPGLPVSHLLTGSSAANYKGLHFKSEDELEKKTNTQTALLDTTSSSPQLHPFSSSYTRHEAEDKGTVGDSRNHTPALCSSQSTDMKHILLVDDDMAIRGCIRQLLEHQGYVCTEADNGADALAKVDSNSFSLIISDNQMPIMDGISFLEAHYRISPSPIPVIMVTGQLTDTLRLRAHNIGVRTIFEKPCNFHSLSHAINKVVSESS